MGLNYLAAVSVEIAISIFCAFHATIIKLEPAGLSIDRRDFYTDALKLATRNSDFLEQRMRINQHQLHA